MIGVYLIRHTVSFKAYVGSSNDLWCRCLSHKAELNRGVHCNKHLQRAWTKHGSDTFEFLFLETCSEKDKITREQHWMDLLQSEYNSRQAGPGGRLSEETKKSIGESNAKAAQERPELILGRSERARRQHTEGRLGRKTWKPGTEEVVQQKLQNAWTDERKQKNADRMLGNQHAAKPHKPDARAKKKVTQKRMWEENRDELMLKINSYWTPERRAQQGVRMAEQLKNGDGRLIKRRPS